MNIINAANCASPDSIFNTGIPLCDLAKKKLKALIFVDRGVQFTPADCSSAASFINAVKAKTIAARGARAYPVWNILNFEDQTGDPTTGGIGNLTTATIVTADAIPAFRFGYNGSEAMHKKMSAMASGSLDVLLIDEGYAVYGTQNGVNIKGFGILQAYSYTSKFIVSDAINQYSFRLTFGNISEYRDQSAYVVANAGLSAILGLININLSYLSNAANVYKIQAFAEGGTDMAALYGAAIAGATWTAKNLETGATLVITSVAYDSVNSAFTVTFDSTAYGLMSAGDRIQLNAPTAALLSAAGVKPFEGLALIIVK